MAFHMRRQTEKIRSMLSAQADRVSRAVRCAIDAAKHRDPDRAQAVIEGDREIDRAEIDIEEECLHTLACYQPVAFDLRYLVAVLKMNNDLERIADLAVNLAEQAKFLANEPPADLFRYIDGMTERVRLMLEEVLAATLDLDAERAGAVRSADEQVDMLHRRMYEHVETAMRQQPELVPQLLHLTGISRHLERIGDLACNIAEDVIYAAHGEILRHAPPRRPSE